MSETILGNEAPKTPDNVMEALVGEGKTYKTVEDLAKGKLNADIHISKIELENKELRDKLAGAKTVDDLLEKINAKTVLEPDNSGNGDPKTSTGLSADQIAELVNKQIQTNATAGRKAANKAAAENKLKELFGDKAGEVFNKEASTPELRAALINLAEVDPTKFVNLFVKEPIKTGSIDTGENGRNTQVIDVGNSQIQPGTQAWYSALRKKDIKTYLSAEMQLRMHSDAQANPAKYFGNG